MDNDDLRERLRSGDALGAWVSLADPAVAELTAPDVDFVALDTEHTPNTLETLTDQTRAVAAAEGDTATIARVPWNDPVRIKRLLDTGVDGLMIPMVESASEAREAVTAARYPPEGERGVAAARASEYGRTFDEYVTDTSDELLLFVQIERPAGVANAADIATVDGVDALFVGPADLSANLGVFGEFESDTFHDAVESVVSAGGVADVPVGTLATAENHIEQFLNLGFDFLIAGVDTGHLLAGNARMRAAYEDARK